MSSKISSIFNVTSKIAAVVMAFGVFALPWAGHAASPGKDGDLTVTAPNTILNAVSPLSQSASVGDTYLRVTNLAALQPLVAGDLLLVYQAFGASIDTTNSPTFGNVTALNGAGLYEFVTVVSTQSPNRINIATACGGLRNAYVASAGSQVVKVPQYRNLTVQSGASITCPAWNGSTGGVLALSVAGTLYLHGNIDASAKGFRGGATHNSSNNTGNNITDYRSGNAARGAFKGEGIAEPSQVSGNGQYCRGAAANGGGGGNSFNAGGGGGANGDNGNPWLVANGTTGGQGVMELTVPGWLAAWQLDPAYAANSNAITNLSGGGRGGYTMSQNDQNALTVGPDNSLWGGNNRRERGGLGGRPVPNNPASRLFFGGGGGAGDGDDSVAGRGGNGGGLVFIMAGRIEGSGQILSNGEAGGWSGEAAITDGAGGGGGG
ncbi:MAG: hypothetical protein N2Z21_10185, partial [Candidatus Sumerlaeaceae bacterium]|nr:hypothetical protein [Candidatus Sumerlaeaceae bacterium]